MSPRRINEADHGQFELGRHLHLRQSFPVPFGMWAAVEAFSTLFQRLAFLLADKHHFAIFNLGESRPDRSIIAEGLVAMQFDKFVEHQLEIVVGLRPFGVPRHLDRFPRVQIVEDVAFQTVDFDPHIADLFADFRSRRVGPPLVFQCQQFLFEIIHRSFKRQTMRDRHN